MIIIGELNRRSVKQQLGQEAQCTWGWQRGRRHFWPATTITIAYAAALRRLREVHGPLARFKRMDQAGVESWAAMDREGGNVLALRVGAPDWAALLHDVL